MWQEFLSVLAGPALLLGANAQEAVLAPLPQNFDISQLVSESLLAQAPPQGEQPGQPAPEIRAFLINHKPCAETGFHLTYRIIVRNQGTVPLIDLEVQNQYPAGTTWSAAETFPTAQRAPDSHDPINHLLIWNEGFLAPGTFVSYTFTVKVEGGGGAHNNSLSVTAGAAVGGPVRVFTNLVIPGVCNLPALAPAKARDQKEAAILCDVAEVGCVQFFPGLGINFRRAQQPENQVRICAPNDPRGCGPNKPELGIRFAEAIADTIPGDCRVVPDDVITTPEFHDGLNRRSKPAAFYVQPLYDAGQNFRRVVLENALLGIGHTRRSQQRLQDLRQPGEIANALNDLKRDYETVQTVRKAKFDKVAEQALEQAAESIRRACGGEQSNHPAVLALRAALARVKQEYEANLDRRVRAYEVMQQAFLAEARAFDPKEEAGERRKRFDALFERTFTAHRKEDEASDNRVRTEQWEVALDGPKAAATDCEKENVFAAEVETKTTWCESNGYLPHGDVVARRPVGVRQDAAPPNLNDITNRGPQSRILANFVQGQVCGGGPGDPWWERDCRCQCNELVTCPFDGEVKTCQECYADTLTRHDVFVASKEECLADGPGHRDPFF